MSSSTFRQNPCDGEHESKYHRRSYNRKKRTKPKGMNRTEVAYRKVLELRKGLDVGDIESCVFEGKTFVLSDKYECSYTPDFFVKLVGGGIECHEVKGGPAKDDSKVKFKWAAETNPTIKFFWCVGTRVDRDIQFDIRDRP